MADEVGVDTIQSVTRRVTALLEQQDASSKTCIVQALAWGRHSISSSDVADEALEGIIGGTEAIGHALTNLAFHVAKNRQVAVRLRQELFANSFSPDMPTSTLSSKFPYLVR